MIYGIGTDICDIRRISATFERQGERFARRVLSDAELVVGSLEANAGPNAACATWRRAFPPRKLSARR